MHDIEIVPKNGWIHFGGTGKIAGFVKGELRVLIGLERVRRQSRARLHLSISCEYRYPTWEEIKDARYSLLPEKLTFAQILPPPDEYVNIHPNCFHLWEIGDGEW